MTKHLFAWVWQNWLYDEYSHQACRVVKVTGLRSCLLKAPGGYHKYATFYGLPWQNRVAR